MLLLLLFLVQRNTWQRPLQQEAAGWARSDGGPAQEEAAGGQRQGEAPNGQPQQGVRQTLRRSAQNVRRQETLQVRHAPDGADLHHDAVGPAGVAARDLSKPGFFLSASCCRRQ